MAKETLISPLNKPIHGHITVSGDKSMSHRAILFSAMANGISHVEGVLNSEDVKASIRAIKMLGARVDLKVAKDGSLYGEIEGWGHKGPKSIDEPIDCANSGTTARLLLGILAGWDVEVTLTGDDSLKSRPMRRITAPLMMMGAKFLPSGAEHLPITVCGSRNLKSIDYVSPMASAQLKTAILLAGISAKGKTIVREPAMSRNHTELMLPEYGVDTVANTCYAEVTGPKEMKASDVSVPGDASSAAFLCALAILNKGSDLIIDHVLLNPARTGFLRTLERMEANISWNVEGSEGKETYGNIHVAYSPDLKGCEIPAKYFATVIDEVPILSLVASRAKGVSVFRNCMELKTKESNRLQAIIDGLTSLGASAWTHGNDLFVEGDPDFSIKQGTIMETHKDHRMALSWAVAALTGNASLNIKDFDCIDVSYPSFLEDVAKLSDD